MLGYFHSLETSPTLYKQETFLTTDTIFSVTDAPELSTLYLEE
jgi:hypothetical protein